MNITDDNTLQALRSQSEDHLDKFPMTREEYDALPHRSDGFALISRCGKPGIDCWPFVQVVVFRHRLPDDETDATKEMCITVLRADRPQMKSSETKMLRIWPSHFHTTGDILNRERPDDSYTEENDDAEALSSFRREDLVAA